METKVAVSLSEDSAESDDLLKEHIRAELSKLTSMCVGNRTIKEFSASSGVSRSLLSKIINSKLENPPSKRSLLRIAQNNSNPRNGITVKDFYKAVKYQEFPDESSSEFDIDSKPPQSDNKNTGGINGLLNSPKLSLYILLDYVESKLNEFEYSIECKPDYYKLILPHKDFDIVCISALCPDDSTKEIVKLSVLYKLIADASIDSTDRIVNMIITDNDSLAKALEKPVEVFSEKRIMIYYFNRNSETISKCWTNFSLRDNGGKEIFE